MGDHRGHARAGITERPQLEPQSVVRLHFLVQVPGHDVVACDDGSRDRAATGGSRLGQRMDHDVGPMFERPHERRGGDGRVHDERDAVTVGEVRYRPHVGERLLRIRGDLRVQEARSLIDQRLPLLDVPRLPDPAHLRAPLRHPDVEQLERAAVRLAGGDEVDVLGARPLPGQQRLDRLLDRRHAG